MSSSRAPSTALVVVRLAKTLEIVLSDVGLTLNQFRLLTLIEEATITPTELSTRLVMKPPNVTAMINSLAERGLIRRSRSSHDARQTRLHLTRRGNALLDRAGTACEATLVHLAASIDADRAPHLLAALDCWLPALNAAAAELRRNLRSQSTSTRTA
jgi:DNA-binding MarR family transcriptional regulator